MAQTFNSRRLRLERAIDDRLTGAHAEIARLIAAIVASYATIPTPAGPAVPNTQRVRDAIRLAIWVRVLKPFYIGAGDDPLDGPIPQSAFAAILVDGITQATHIQAEAQQAVLRRVVSDELVYNWLTAPRPFINIAPRSFSFDPFYRYVDPNGYRLSDRIWRDAVDVRSRVERLLDYHIGQGDSAVEIADLLEDFLTPGAKLIKTRTPYGREGSYAARRLARTEVTAAAGRATIEASTANPFVESVRWSLSMSHPCCDICDDYAKGGPAGDGVYPLSEVPPYPAHPHELCNLQPVPMGSTADLVDQLRAGINQRTPAAEAMRGRFNADYLTQAILGGVTAAAFAAVTP